MKRIIIAVLLASFLLGLVGCKEMDGSVSADAFPENYGIVASAKDITNTGLTLMFENSILPVGSISLGRYFAIQVLENDEWKDLETKTEAVFHTDAFIPNDNNWSMDVEWEWLYGELPAGTYRVLKTIDISAGSIGVSVDTRIQETLDILVEFELTDA